MQTPLPWPTMTCIHSMLIHAAAVNTSNLNNMYMYGRMIKGLYMYIYGFSLLDFGDNFNLFC